MKNFYEAYQQILNNNKLSREEKIVLLQQAKENFDKQITQECNREIAKYALGAALEIGSAAIPMSGVGKLGAQLGLNALKSNLGRKISQEIGAGMTSGATSGAVFGTGRGILENKNPLKTSIQDALTGALSGGALGAGGAYLQKGIRDNQLRDFQYNPQVTKELRKLAEQNYKDYIQGRIVNHTDLGNIEFTRKGMDETFSKNPELVKQFPDLIKNIQNSKISTTNDLYKIRKDDITKFHTLQNPNKEFLIGESVNVKKKFYLAKERATDQGLPPSLGGASISDTNTIIHNNSSKFNPTDGQSEQIFTREQIKNMSNDEFLQNEKAIMKQMKEKGIPTNRELEQKRKQNSSATKSSTKGRWVTINGNHVFIED